MLDRIDAILVEQLGDDPVDCEGIAHVVQRSLLEPDLFLVQVLLYHFKQLVEIHYRPLL